MKLKHISSIGLSFLLTLNACSDYLDYRPDDYLTEEIVFNEKNSVEKVLANLYSDIPDCSYNQISVIGWDVLSDDPAPSPRWTGFGGWKPILLTQGNWSPSTAWGANYWSILPQRIRTAYWFLNNIKPVEGITEARVEQMKLEARFTVAYYYWILISSYGAIPYFSNTIDPSTPTEQLFIGQEPFYKMVDILDKELYDLSQSLPIKYENNKDYGRATSVMCLAIRARMLLFAASPLVNGNPDYIGHKNHRGEEIFDGTYDISKWKKAAEAHKLLIETSEGAGHKLYKEYNSDGTIDPFRSYFYATIKFASEGNTETLFARPATSNTYLVYHHCVPRGAGGGGGYGVTQELVDAFFMNNGLPAIEFGKYGDALYDATGKPVINKASGYAEDGWLKAHDYRKNTTWKALFEDNQIKVVATNGTFKMYAGREPRFYCSVLYNNNYYRHYAGKDQPGWINFLSGAADGGPTHDASPTGYLLRKGIHDDCVRREGIDPARVSIIYRLAEAYLSYAEALLESERNPGNAEIWKYINLIRERAGIPQYGSGVDSNGLTMIPIPATFDDAMKVIRRERRVELHNESIRYDDLRRWKAGEELLNRDFGGMNFAGTNYWSMDASDGGYFVRTTYLKRVYKKEYYWWPIYQGEIDKDNSLVQAPFWDKSTN